MPWRGWARWMPLRTKERGHLLEPDGEDLEVLGERDTGGARRAIEAAGSAGDREHGWFGLLRPEGDGSLDGQAAAVPHGGDDAVRQRLVCVLLGDLVLGDPGQDAHAGVVADDRVAAVDLAGDSELVIDDQLVALQVASRAEERSVPVAWGRCV